MTARYILPVLLISAIAAPAAAQPDSRAQVEAAEKQIVSGDIPGAIAALERIAAASPQSFDARLLLGRALDLEGRHAAARAQLEDALKLASDEQRNTALTALGVSYAFESKPDEAARYYQRVFDGFVQGDDRAGAANIANGLARIYLESGNLQKAQQWYTTGYEMAKKIAGLPAPQAALWEMRWHHAMARLAARRGETAATAEHVAAVRAAFEKGLPDGQRPAYPYLLGYVAFYAADYRTAVTELMKGDQNDPFVLGLIAQSYEKLGEREKAGEFHRKVMASGAHSINAAFARPRARAFLK